jgi:hypothetical protein
VFGGGATNFGAWLDRARAQEIFPFFEEALVQRSCESWGQRGEKGQSAEWICVRWWHDTDRAARRKRFRISKRRRSAEELQKLGLE